MTAAEKKFNKIVDRYKAAYLSTNGAEKTAELDIFFARGFVYVNCTPVRVKKFEAMTVELENRADYQREKREFSYIAQKEMENKAVTFSEEELRNSPEFINYRWSTIEVLVHNAYYDSKEITPAYIVITRPTTHNVQLWSIARFYKMGEKIQMSIDHQLKPAEEIFNLLLTEYSRGLK